jgi:hypothetical protein
MTFKFTDNYRTKPIREDINRKIEQAESEGFGSLGNKPSISNLKKPDSLIKAEKAYSDFTKKYGFINKIHNTIRVGRQFYVLTKPVLALYNSVNDNYIYEYNKFLNDQIKSKNSIKKDFSFYPVKNKHFGDMDESFGYNVPKRKYTKAQKIHQQKLEKIRKSPAYINLNNEYQKISKLGKFVKRKKGYLPYTVFPSGVKERMNVISNDMRNLINIQSAQMNGFANDNKSIRSMIQDYGGDFDSNENLVSTESDEMFGWGIKIKSPKSPKFKAPKLKAPKITVGKSPVKGIVKAVTRPVAGIVKKPSSVIPKAVKGIVKKPIASLVKPVSSVAKIVTTPLRTVVTPVMGVVSSVPVVGQYVQPALATSVGIVGMIPLVGQPASNIVADISTKTGVLQNIPVPSGYATSPSTPIAVEPAKTPAPLLPSATYTSPAPIVSSPLSQSGSSTPNISSSSMPSSSSSGSEGGGGGGGGGGGYSSSSNAQESEANEDGIISDKKPEIKKPIVAPASNGKKVIGALAGVTALWLAFKK